MKYSIISQFKVKLQVKIQRYQILKQKEEGMPKILQRNVITGWIKSVYRLMGSKLTQLELLTQ
jgi:hypothetical protein